LDRLFQSNESHEVQRYRDIAVNTENEFNIDPNDWFSDATARIDQLTSTKQALLTEIALYAQGKISSRLFDIIAESLVLILMLAIAYVEFSTIRLRASQSFEINRFMKKMDSEKDLTDSVTIFPNMNLVE
jgi:hypothetical protein